MNEGMRDEGRGHEGMRARGKTEGYEIEEGKARENTHSGWAGGRLVSFFLHILNWFLSSPHYSYGEQQLPNILQIQPSFSHPSLFLYPITFSILFIHYIHFP